MCSSDTRLSENVAKFKSKYHTKFGCPNCCSSWDFKPWINVKFSFSSNFEHFYTICSSDINFEEMLLRSSQSATQFMRYQWINNIFSFFSNFKHIHTICSSDNRLWENVGIDNFRCDFGCHNVLSWILLSFTNIELQVNLTFGSLIFTRTVNFLLQKNPFPTSKMTAKRYSIPYIQLLLSSHIFSPEVGEPLIFFGKHFFTFPSPHVGAMAPGHFYEEWKWLRVCFGSRLPEMELKRAYKYSIYIKNKA